MDGRYPRPVLPVRDRIQAQRQSYTFKFLIVTLKYKKNQKKLIFMLFIILCIFLFNPIYLKYNFTCKLCKNYNEISFILFWCQLQQHTSVQIIHISYSHMWLRLLHKTAYLQYPSLSLVNIIIC